MKKYTIGRSTECNIVVEDGKDHISRHHATLTVSTWGKMTIMDKSRNGTYINGSRITTGEAVPVTRKDAVSFAHAADLDWSLVPRTDIWLKLGVAVLAILLLGGIIWGVFCNKSTGQPEPIAVGADTTAVIDSAKIAADSITIARNDSIEKAEQDSILKAKVNEVIKEQQKGQKAQPKKEKETPKEPEKPKEEKPKKTIG